MACTPEVDGAAGDAGAVGVAGVVVVVGAVVVATVVVGAVGLTLAALEPLHAITVAARAARLAAPRSGCVITVPPATFDCPTVKE